MVRIEFRDNFAAKLTKFIQQNPFECSLLKIIAKFVDFWTIWTVTMLSRKREYVKGFVRCSKSSQISGRQEIDFDSDCD